MKSHGGAVCLLFILLSVCFLKANGAEIPVHEAIELPDQSITIELLENQITNSDVLKANGAEATELPDNPVVPEEVEIPQEVAIKPQVVKDSSDEIEPQPAEVTIAEYVSPCKSLD